MAIVVNPPHNIQVIAKALHPKWRAKVWAIEESKDLSSLALDELIGNLKVHEVVMEKDSEIYKGKKERIKSIALKAKKESSDDETSTSGSDNEEYAMVIKRPSLEVLGLIPENDAKYNSIDETCLKLLQSSNEVTLNSSYYSDNASSLDNDKEDQYTVLEIWKEYNILEDIKCGPYSKKSLIRRIQSLDTPYRTDSEYGVSTSIKYSVSDFLSNTAYSFKLINEAYPLPLDTAYRSSGIEADSKRHFKSLSLDELRSPDFNLFYDQEYLEEEEAEAMAETMEHVSRVFSKSEGHYYSRDLYRKT
ncbi:hypothetical protein Tco_0803743 [Tanacetum coccineum]|uniref:UBN2 domain-containing protein n=1 Tax=Tanacetum coccineum TaxID=301880 RepID=A0ABQ5A6Q5_9ASTR